MINIIRLNDGRDELWQWDTGRTLAVDAECSQVHFSNNVFGRSVDVDVIDGSARIPDFLLQTEKDLYVWAFAGTPENGYTKLSKLFKVNKRNKPADYVFTPTEQVTISDISNRLKKVEEAQDPEKIEEIVNNAISEAKESGEFDGKNAYEYAVDGGYKGTEGQFSEKLAKDLPEALWFSISGKNGVYTADKSFVDVLRAAVDLKPVYCSLTFEEGDSEFESFVVTPAFIGTEYMLFSGLWGEDSVNVLYARDLIEVELVPLIGRDDLPEKLPNPAPLRLVGAVNAVYDGSKEETVDIPTIAGKPGFSPTVEVVRVTGGTRLFITTEDGRQEAYIPDGKDANIFTAIVGETTDTEIVNAVKEGKPVCASWKDGRTAWMKQAQITSGGTLVSAVFSDYFGMSAAKVSWKFNEGSGVEGIGGVGMVANSVNSASAFMTSKNHTPGDYTLTVDFVLKDKIPHSLDRDEGFYIRPLDKTTNPNIETVDGRSKKYTVRASTTQGVQLIYGTNTNGDYGGVLAGVYYEDGSYKEGNGNLPKSLEPDVLYTIKVQKKDDSLRVKCWEAGSVEPGWQVEHRDKSIGAPAGEEWDARYVWGCEMSFHNVFEDSERLWVGRVEFEDENGVPFWGDIVHNPANAIERFSFSGPAVWSEFARNIDAEKEEVVNEVLGRLPTWTGGSY